MIHKAISRDPAATASPWLHTCYDERMDRVTERLRSDYFGRYAIPEQHGATSYTDTYSD